MLSPAGDKIYKVDFQVEVLLPRLKSARVLNLTGGREWGKEGSCYFNRRSVWRPLPAGPPFCYQIPGEIKFKFIYQLKGDSQSNMKISVSCDSTKSTQLLLGSRRRPENDVSVWRGTGLMCVAFLFLLRKIFDSFEGEFSNLKKYQQNFVKIQWNLMKIKNI